jgi:thioredoxin reductase (NADPH)
MQPPSRIGIVKKEITPEDLIKDEEAFPHLCEVELQKAAAFGTRRSFKKGDTLFSAGDSPFDCHLLLSGEVCVYDVSRDERACIVRYQRGYFSGDIDLFTCRAAVATCEALEDTETMAIPPANLRRMFVLQPSLGERFWRAFQRRRALMLETPFQGVRVFGPKSDAKTLDTVEFLFRNGVPHQWMDTAEEKNVERLRRIVPGAATYPTLTYGGRLMFEAPTHLEIAERIGLRHRPRQPQYDVVIIGAGPSGLGSAVYAASEGLTTLVLDGLGPGGQAGASSKIENYAGFPNGLAGAELAQLAYLQALKFSAEFNAPSHVACLKRTPDGLYQVCTVEGDCVHTKTVIIATGVSYRLLDATGLERLTGPGVYYNATKIEAAMCESRTVHVVGAGNSAGQASMFLSQYAEVVHLIVRGEDLSKSMSSYLSDRVLANERIKISYDTMVTGIEGTESIEAVHLRDGHGNVRTEETAGLFIFIGARPRTDFLPAEVLRDDKGFVLTGVPVAESGKWPDKKRLPCALETVWPGVFASGDCRSGTTKRVAFAIGDGALAVTCVHDFLGTYA